jgi:hypothetical protein
VIDRLRYCGLVLLMVTLASCESPVDELACSGPIKLTTDQLQLGVGDSATLSGTAEGCPSKVLELVWASSNAAVATIRPTGPATAVVRAEATGIVYVFAATRDDPQNAVAALVIIPATGAKNRTRLQERGSTEKFMTDEPTLGS